MARLSKNHFKAWIQCSLRAWHQIHSADLIPPPTAIDQYRWATGAEVGKLAQRLFPGGVTAQPAAFSFQAALEETTRLMADNSVGSIFEAAFEWENIRLRVDILEREPQGHWKLIEVKDSTRIKDDHLLDVWFQSYVLQRLGLDIQGRHVLLLNKEYVFDGSELDIRTLFVRHAVDTELLKLDDGLLGQFFEFKKTVTRDQQPSVAPTKHCKAKDADKECEFFAHCTRDKPEHWIYQVPRISEKTWQELSDSGIEDIAQIPEDFKLTAKQQVVRDAVVSGQPVVKDGLKENLESISPPYHFIDFETANPAIPKYANTRPYEQIPFQWSCHVQQENGSLSQSSFLHSEHADPREPFAQTLIDCLGNSGSVIHYKPFEKTVLNALSESVPHLRENILAIVGRLVDISKILSDHYYNPAFHGSYSVKNVLPVLCPDLSYDDLEIQDGSMAAIQYMRMIEPETSDRDRASIREALLKYCGLDTLAIVRIREKLAEISD